MSRLDEIKERVNYKDLLVKPPIHRVDISKEDFDWIIQRIDKLTKALQFYSDANYLLMPKKEPLKLESIHPRTTIETFDLYEENGMAAREALAEDQNES